MRKVKLIVHETYQGKRKSEDVFAAVFLSNAATLTPNTHSGILKTPNDLRIHFVPRKEQLMEQVGNEQTIYSAAVYCRLSKDDEQAGESVSINAQGDGSVC